MSNTLLTIGLDIIVICLLSATIFFVLRLYKGLNEFKTQRKQFDTVIRNLLSAINQAERSIQTLKDTSTTEAAALEQLIAQSKALSEELSIINGTGESIAKRIEQLAEKNRKIGAGEARTPAKQRNIRRSEPQEKQSPRPRKEPSQPKQNKEEKYAETLKKVKSSARKPKKTSSGQDLPSFMTSSQGAEHMDNDENAQNLQSQAERELYEALRSNKKQQGKG